MLSSPKLPFVRFDTGNKQDTKRERDTSLTVNISTVCEDEIETASDAKSADEAHRGPQTRIYS